MRLIPHLGLGRLWSLPTFTQPKENIMTDQKSPLKALLKEIEHKANPSKWNCSYCPFFEEKHLCFASSNPPSIRISDTTISQ